MMHKPQMSQSQRSIGQNSRQSNGSVKLASLFKETQDIAQQDDVYNYNLSFNKNHGVSEPVIGDMKIEQNNSFKIDPTHIEYQNKQPSLLEQLESISSSKESERISQRQKNQQ